MEKGKQKLYWKKYCLKRKTLRSEKMNEYQPKKKQNQKQNEENYKPKHIIIYLLKTSNKEEILKENKNDNT